MRDGPRHTCPACRLLGVLGVGAGQEDLGTRQPPGLGILGSCNKLLGQRSQFLTLSLSML